MTEQERLEQLLDQQEATIQRAFRQFLAQMNSDTVAAALTAKLEANDVPGAMAIVDSYIIQLSNVIPTVAAAVGAFTATELTNTVRAAIPEQVNAISFDPSWPRAAEIIQQHRADFLEHFTQEQRAATSQALARSFREGTHVRQAAREFRNSIGMTPRDEQAVANYRTLLESRSKQALTRDLRDRRSDVTIERAIERNRPLTEKQIDTMVDRYRRNMLAQRAETVAITETTRAASEARDEATRQMIDQTGIEEDRIEEIWNATRDNRTRSFHASMNGQRRALGVPFTDGLGNSLRYPGDPKAPLRTIIRCRCNKTISVKPSTE